MYKISENEEFKMLSSSRYNYVFDKATGFFCRWGKDKAEDPVWCEYGPEILDIEVSTVCSRACSWCYKSNNHQGKNMSFDIFKSILDKIPNTLTQVAFGIGSIDANKDLWKMMKYCRDKGVIPNITINGDRMTNKYANNIHNLCGAVAVSLYDKDICYQAVKELGINMGMKQTNIHYLFAKETYRKAKDIIKDASEGKIEGLNAIVFLILKPKGKRNNLSSPTKEQFNDLIQYAIDKKINFGFDSCSANKFIEAVKDSPDYKRYFECAEPCESSIFSYYINVDGVGYPCSFSEDVVKGVDVLNCNDFISDVWGAIKTKKFRGNLLNNGRNCPIYNI